MNKRDMAKAIGNKLSVCEYQAYSFIDLFIEVAQENLALGHKLVISRFGSFLVKEKKAKRVMNPNNKEFMVIAPAKTIKFIAAKNLKQMFK